MLVSTLQQRRFYTRSRSDIRQIIRDICALSGAEHYTGSPLLAYQRLAHVCTMVCAFCMIGVVVTEFYPILVLFEQSTFSAVELYSLDCPVFGMAQSLTWKAKRC